MDRTPEERLGKIINILNDLPNVKTQLLLIKGLPNEEDRKTALSLILSTLPHLIGSTWDEIEEVIEQEEYTEMSGETRLSFLEEVNKYRPALGYSIYSLYREVMDILLSYDPFDRQEIISVTRRIEDATLV